MLLLERLHRVNYDTSEMALDLCGVVHVFGIAFVFIDVKIKHFYRF